MRIVSMTLQEAYVKLGNESYNLVDANKIYVV